jgi:hypothetical protein
MWLLPCPMSASTAGGLPSVPQLLLGRPLLDPGHHPRRTSPRIRVALLQSRCSPCAAVPLLVKATRISHVPFTLEREITEIRQGIFPLADPADNAAILQVK